MQDNLLTLRIDNLIHRLVYILLFLVFGTSSNLLADGTMKRPSCHKQYREHHIGLFYAPAYQFGSGYVHKISLSYQRRETSCKTKIGDPSKNIFWFDINPTFKKLGYSRSFQLDNYFYRFADPKFDKKYPFYAKLIDATQLDGGIGYQFGDETKNRLIYRITPRLDFRFFKNILEVGPYYNIDLSIRKERFQHEFGLKLGFHFGIRKEVSPSSHFRKDLYTD